ncbi:tail assembly chaperone [Mycobacterium phage BirdsNest]|uniref:Tail assembly chaperone n=1 Tax=Mycobacterium phage BirdsNest TaxID=2686231 RepID=A0A6B9LD54_9CAUD|nr:tail assembly chaperone [Mycobacterium phage BirdsNest]QHB37331.1 hypothetical protein PBI_BIRDSNEST_29 [Mycobacterium phage BirdsNest]
MARTFGENGKLGVAGGAAPDEEQLQPPADLTVPSTDESEHTDEDARIEAAIAEAATDEDILKPEPEPGVKVETPEVIEKPKPTSTEVAQVDIEPGTAIAAVERFDVTKSGEAWPYDMLEFKGDLLGVRLPDRKALAAFSLASSKYVKLEVKNDLTGLFIARHLSPESYGRVFSRLMDPDEESYDVETVGELFNAVVTASLEADKDAAKGNDAG